MLQRKLEGYEYESLFRPFWVGPRSNGNLPILIRALRLTDQSSNTWADKLAIDSIGSHDHGRRKVTLSGLSC
jgi:hypothetical protein